jgi:hypothetical protein
MKKAFFLGIVVLAALAMVTCDNFAAPKEEGPSGYITIGTSNARAMTNDLAYTVFDFYEVAFYYNDGTDDCYIRTSWNRGETGIIQPPPPGDYGDSEAAILFAGSRAAGNTLLAVGLLTLANGSAGGSYIGTDTTKVTFTLVPFQSDVKPDPASSFKIIDPVDGAYLKTDEYTAATFPLVPIDLFKRPVPLFLIPKNTSNIKATFEITMPANTYSDYEDGIYALGTSKVTVVGITGGSAGSGLVDVTFDNANPTGGGLLVLDGTNAGEYVIEFDIETQNGNYYNKIYFDIPVNAISDEDDIDGTPAGTWHIRGGPENHLYDEGADYGLVGSTGGAIVLGVGGVNFITIDAVDP